MMYFRLLIIDDASMDAKSEDFAKRDGCTDGPTDRHTGFLGCNGRIQNECMSRITSFFDMTSGPSDKLH